MSRYANVGGTAVLLDGGGGEPTATFPAPILSDTVLTATSILTTVTTTGAAAPDNLTTPGAWSVVDTSLSAAAGGVSVYLVTNTLLAAGSSLTLLDIGTGALGAETVWATVPIGNLALGYYFVVPGLIAAGERVSVRIRSAAETLKAVQASYAFLPANGLGAPTTVGVTIATAQGVSVPYGGTLNTWSGWTVISASSPADIDVLLCRLQLAGDTNVNVGTVLFQLGVGAASSEVPVATFCHLLEANEFFRPRNSETVAVSIPAGSRITGRWQSNASGLAAIDAAFVGAALT